MHPTRLIHILGTPVYAKGMQVEDGQWTISVWLREDAREAPQEAPDLVFPTLMRNFDQAFALVGISVRDHLRAVRAGGAVLPTGIRDLKNEGPTLHEVLL